MYKQNPTFLLSQSVYLVYWLSPNQPTDLFRWFISAWSRSSREREREREHSAWARARVSFMLWKLVRCGRYIVNYDCINKVHQFQWSTPNQNDWTKYKNKFQIKFQMSGAVIANGHTWNSIQICTIRYDWMFHQPCMMCLCMSYVCRSHSVYSGNRSSLQQRCTVMLMIKSLWSLQWNGKFETRITFFIFFFVLKIVWNISICLPCN